MVNFREQNIRTCFRSERIVCQSSKLIHALNLNFVKVNVQTMKVAYTYLTEISNFLFDVSLRVTGSHD